jgi:hypothetical protein
MLLGVDGHRQSGRRNRCGRKDVVVADRGAIVAAALVAAMRADRLLARATAPDRPARSSGLAYAGAGVDQVSTPSEIIVITGNSWPAAAAPDGFSSLPKSCATERRRVVVVAHELAHHEHRSDAGRGCGGPSADSGSLISQLPRRRVSPGGGSAVDRAVAGGVWLISLRRAGSRWLARRADSFALRSWAADAFGAIRRLAAPPGEEDPSCWRDGGLPALQSGRQLRVAETPACAADRIRRDDDELAAHFARAQSSIVMVKLISNSPACRRGTRT